MFVIIDIPGMFALHNMIPTVLHRDLKSGNVLVNGDLHVKVCIINTNNIICKNSPFTTKFRTHEHNNQLWDAIVCIMIIL
jgi:hypothetical protein